DPNGRQIPIEQAIVMLGSDRAHYEDEIARLERMVPALMRPGGTRRGEVILGPDEAWDMLASTGPRLQTAGFDVRAPALAPCRDAPARARTRRVTARGRHFHCGWRVGRRSARRRREAADRAGERARRLSRSAP